MNNKVFIRQDGTIPGHRIIEELVRRGAKDNNYMGIFKDLCYYIDDNKIDSLGSYETPDLLEGYTELLYNKETDSFHEKTDCSDCVNDRGCINCQDGDMKETKSERMVSAEAEEKLIPNETEELSQNKIKKLNEFLGHVWIPNAPIKGQTIEYNIPEGYEAKIEDGKVIVSKKKWRPKECEDYYYARYEESYHFQPKYDQWTEGDSEVVLRYENDNVFKTKADCQAFCDKLNNAVKPVLEERRKEAEG